MKNHYLVKSKTGEVDENGFDNHEFAVTKHKYANAKVARKQLEKVFECSMDEADITPCPKDWKGIK